MKNIFDGWLKNFVQESKAVILLQLHRFIEPLLNPKSLAPILGIWGKFSISLLATKLYAGAFGPVLETSSGILSLPKRSCELSLASLTPHVQKSVHMTFFSLCMLSKSFIWVIKTLTALDEYHRPRQNAYRNKQIIQACFARWPWTLKPTFLALSVSSNSLFLLVFRKTSKTSL